MKRIIVAAVIAFSVVGCGSSGKATSSSTSTTQTVAQTGSTCLNIRANWAAIVKALRTGAYAGAGIDLQNVGSDFGKLQQSQAKLTLTHVGNVLLNGTYSADDGPLPLSEQRALAVGIRAAKAAAASTCGSL
jgi:hypothetical protein